MNCQIGHNIEDKIRTKDIQINENVDFASMLLSDAVLQGILANGFKKPSPIQLKAIPMGRCGYDLIIQAKSGTGKTAVFGIIALEMVNVTEQKLQVVILVPAREIAVQIKDVIERIGMNLKDLKVEYFIGGMSTEEDHKKLNNCHIAVGTPGRVKQLIKTGNMKIDFVRLFVLDEADKLLSVGQQKDINFIYNKLKFNKQMIASSATYPGDLKNFLAKYMHSPAVITPHQNVPILLGIRQFVTTVKSHLNVMQQMTLKTEELIRILQTISFTQCVIFSNYQTRAETLSNNLISKGWPTIYISAAQDQKHRLEAMTNLKEFKCRIVSTTDLTARGIDAANVDLVINYEVPNDFETYLHRMGRAGRYGTTGLCISIAAEGTEEEKLKDLLNQLGNNLSSVMKFPTESIPQNMWTCDLENFEKIYAKNKIESEQNCNIIAEECIENKINKEKHIEIVSENIQRESDLEIQNNVDLLLQSIKTEDDMENKSRKHQFNNMSPADIVKLLSSGQSTSIVNEKTNKLEKETKLKDINESTLCKEENSSNIEIKDEIENLEQFLTLQTEETFASIKTSEENCDKKLKKSKRKKAKKNINNDGTNKCSTLDIENNKQFENEAKLFQQNNIVHRNIALYNITKLMTERESLMTDSITGTEKLLQIIEYEDKLEIKQQKNKLDFTELLNQLGLQSDTICTCSENLFCDVFNYAISKTDIDWQNNLCQFHKKQNDVTKTKNDKEEDEEYNRKTEEYYEQNEENYEQNEENYDENEVYYDENEEYYETLAHNQENYEEEVVYDEQIFTKGCDYALQEVNYEKTTTNSEENNVCGYAAIYSYDHLKSERKNIKRKYSKSDQEFLLASESECSSTFESHYDYYDKLLSQYGPYFTDSNEFEKWFQQWQENVYSVRNYIQEAIFTRERISKTDFN